MIIPGVGDLALVQGLSDDELFELLADRDNFELFCNECLRIRTKSGGIEPFVLNKAQLYLHARAEKQLRERGYVRIIVVKGRQQGISTYIGARGYRHASLSEGVRVFILTHEDKATTNLFRMVKRYHEHNLELMKPAVGNSNAKELIFSDLDSSYGLATARSKGSGRSDTVQFFHGSEVAFWAFAEEIASGVMQAIPKGEAALGTEVFLESTAKGVGNYFHKQWQAAERGDSDFEAVFLPWYWQPEYRVKDTSKLILTEEDRAYQEAYGLDLEQMAWRQDKIIELGAELFRQEYPATPAEAFVASVDNTLIPPTLAAQAAKTSVTRATGARILSVDPARFGDDRTGIAYRVGRKVYWVKGYTKKDTMQTVGIVKKLIDGLQPHAVFIDVIGIGAGVVDRLREMGFAPIIRPVNAGDRPLDDEQYVNKRAEMWGEMLAWLEDYPADLPDDDELIADLCSLTYSFDSKGRLVLESKDAAKKRGVRSPDLADAVALGFAEPVATSQLANRLATNHHYHAPTAAGY